LRRVSEEIEVQNEQILNTAIQQFCEKGYAKTRMEDIAQILGITKTPLYYHFKDKAGLFDAAYRKAMDEVYRSDLRIFTKNCCLYDKLVEAFEVCAISAHQLQISEMGRILVKESQELAKTVEYMNEMNALFYQFKTAAMEEAQRSGEIRADADIDELYTLINCCYSGVLEWVNGQEYQNPMRDDEREAIVRRLIGKFFVAIKPLYFN
jgi:AcrR family transcriptional regulator